MNDQVRAVADWMKGTDLVEVAYKKGPSGFSLVAPGSEPEMAAPVLPSSRFEPVISEAVGVLQWSEPGKPRLSEEGCEVAEGAVLAVVVGASGTAKPVKAPRPGRVAKVLAEAGKAVEYGQPILLLEPR